MQQTFQDFRTFKPTIENSKIALKYDFEQFFLKDLCLNGLFAQYSSIATIELEGMWALANMAINVKNENIGLLIYRLENSAFNDDEIEKNKANINLLKEIFDIIVEPSRAGEDGWLRYKSPPQNIPVYFSEKCYKNKKMKESSIDLINTDIPLEIGYTSISKSWMQLLNYGVLARIPYESNFSNVLAIWFLLKNK